MHKHFGLIGAELKGLDVYANYERTSELRRELAHLGLSFVGVMNVSAQVKRQLFLVTDIDEGDFLALARKHGQRAALVADSLGNIEVVSTKSRGRTTLGKLMPVRNREEAEKARFYITFVEDGEEQFFTPQKEGRNERTKRVDCRGC